MTPPIRRFGAAACAVITLACAAVAQEAAPTPWIGQTPRAVNSLRAPAAAEAIDPPGSAAVPTDAIPTDAANADQLFSGGGVQEGLAVEDGMAIPGRTAAPPHPPQLSPSDCVGCDSVVGPMNGGFDPSGFDSPGYGPTSQRPWLLRQFDLRHSTTHGRAMGPGEPLRSTSWLNRPVWVSLDTGALIMTSKPADNVRAANDFALALGAGWDLDHYWGAQARVLWSTPELLNTTQVVGKTDDNLFITDLSLLYYPWGDSRLRPYYRFGLGLTDVEYTNDRGSRRQSYLYTIPLAVGVKHQWRRWLACRLELANNLAIGENETATLNNLTLTAGLEWRFGDRPDRYWAWSPRTGGW